MNIALVTTEFPPFPGGIGTYTATLARLLSAGGHGVFVLYAATTPTTPDPGPGVRMIHLSQPHAERHREVAQSFPDLATHVREAIGLSLAVREWLADHAAEARIDVVEVPDHLGMGAMLQDVGLPACVVVGHSTSAEFAWHDGLDRTDSDRLLDAMEFIGLATGDVVACHSRTYQADLAAWLGREVLFAPAPLRPLDAPVRCSYAAADGATRMIVLSRLQIAKGAEVVCRALDMIGADAGIEVDWFGKPTVVGEERVDIRSYLAAKYPSVWGRSLRWHPPIAPEQAWERVRHADAVVVPAIWETYSFVATEAGSLGAPLIVSEGAGASYLFRDDDSACVVPSGDAGALAAAMLRMKNAEVRGRLGPRAREVVTAQLEGGRVLRDRIAVYEQAIARRLLRREKPIFRQGVSAVTDHMFRWAAEAADRRVVNYPSRELLAIVGDRVGARVRRGLGFPGG